MKGLETIRKKSRDVSRMTKRSLVHGQKLRPTSRYMAMNDMNLSTLNNSIKKHITLGPVEAEGGKVKDNLLQRCTLR